MRLPFAVMQRVARVCQRQLILLSSVISILLPTSYKSREDISKGALCEILRAHIPVQLPSF